MYFVKNSYKMKAILFFLQFLLIDLYFIYRILYLNFDWNLNYEMEQHSDDSLGIFSTVKGMKLKRKYIQYLKF